MFNTITNLFEQGLEFLGLKENKPKKRKSTGVLVMTRVADKKATGDSKNTKIYKKYFTDSQYRELMTCWNQYVSDKKAKSSVRPYGETQSEFTKQMNSKFDRNLSKTTYLRIVGHRE